MCSIVFEAVPEESDIMRRPPRAFGEHLFADWTFGISFLQGLTVLLGVLTVYSSAIALDRSEGIARTVAFAALATGNLALAIANRSWSTDVIASLLRPNRALWVAVAAAFGCLRSLRSACRPYSGDSASRRHRSPILLPWPHAGCCPCYGLKLRRRPSWWNACHVIAPGRKGTPAGRRPKRSEVGIAAPPIASSYAIFPAHRSKSARFTDRKHAGACLDLTGILDEGRDEYWRTRQNGRRITWPFPVRRRAPSWSLESPSWSPPSTAERSRRTRRSRARCARPWSDR